MSLVYLLVIFVFLVHSVNMGLYHVKHVQRDLIVPVKRPLIQYFVLWVHILMLMELLSVQTAQLGITVKMVQQLAWYVLKAHIVQMK